MEKIQYENNLYVVLIKAHTGLGKISRIITKYEYTHIAISMEEQLSDFITFSRKKHYSPFDSGFMHERRNYYAFGKNRNVKVKIFKIQLDKDSYIDICDTMKRFEEDKSNIFNIYSMITMPILHGFQVYKAYNCMSFAGLIIKKANAIKMDRPYYKYMIKDYDNLLSEYFYYEGYLEKDDLNDDYMDKISFLKNAADFIKLNIRLIGRIIKQMRIDENEK